MMIRVRPLWEIDPLHLHLDDPVAKEFPQSQPVAAMRPWQPPAELYESGDGFVLRLLLPGVSAADLEIEATREAVTISGQRCQNASDRAILSSEIRYGSFRRAFSLPVAIAHTEVRASYNNGVLTLTLPKAVEARRTKVKVNVSE